MQGLAKAELRGRTPVCGMLTALPLPLGGSLGSLDPVSTDGNRETGQNDPKSALMPLRSRV
jgi:hypothetical protein